MKFITLFEKFINGKKKEWEFLAKGYIPLSPSILQQYEKDIKTAYHVTSVKNLGTLKKLQGKRKTLPTFTKGSESLSMGAASGAEIFVTLKGKSSFEAKLDMTSIMDRNGMRWFNASSNAVNNYDAHNYYSVKMFKKMLEYLKKEGFGDINRVYIEPTVEEMNGKQKAAFINFAFKEAKKLITPAFMKKLDNVISTLSTSGYDNNEILLYDFKIIDVKTIIDAGGNDAMNQRDTERATSRCDDLNLTYSGEITRRNVASINI